MTKKKTERKQYDDGLKREAVRMLLEGYSASSIAKNLGISNPNMIHRWKSKFVSESPEAESLETQVRQLREQLSRAERERDILKKALSIFSQKM
jgi:transposase